jgi:hypothetical protein
MYLVWYTVCWAISVFVTVGAASGASVGAAAGASEGATGAAAEGATEGAAGEGLLSTGLFVGLLGKLSTGRLMLPDGAFVGSGAESTGSVSLTAGASPRAGHWKPDIPPSPTGPAGLVGVATLELVLAAEVEAAGLPVLLFVSDGTRTSEVGILPVGVTSATGALVSSGSSSETGAVGTARTLEVDRMGAFDGISVGIAA